jgi:hypothetical protein
MSKRGVVWLAALVLLAAASARAQAPATESREARLWKACRNGDVAVIKELLDAGMDPNSRFEGGVTPLTAAAMRGQLPALKLLVERGADPNLRDSTFGLTPMGMAAFFGVIPVVDYLLPLAKQDLDVILLLAAQRGIVPHVQAGLRGNPSALDLTRAWSLAKAGNKTEILALLEKAGAQAPPALPPADLARFIGHYQDKSKMEVDIELRDGKLVGTGGDGFESFFEQAVVPIRADVAYVSSSPTTLLFFEGTGGKFPRMTLATPGRKFTLDRSEGGKK